MNDFEKIFEAEFERQKQEIQKPNLIIVGGTGIGKSSLINRVFGEDVARTGEGQPVTHGIDKYEPKKIPLVFYDTEGYEIAGDGSLDKTNFETKVKPAIEEMSRGELVGQIHLVWYCLSISNHRVTDYDLEIINYFVLQKMKTAIVFTQCDNDEELPGGKGKDASVFQSIIEKEIPGLPYFETSAAKKDIPFLNAELERLIEWSANALPNEQLKESFITSQKVSVDKKKQVAYKSAASFAVGAATAAGLNPLPLSDSLLIVPQQVAMAISITKIFGFTNLADSVGSMLQSQLLSIGGKQLAASLLKLLPGIGNVTNAVVAGGLTYALGAAMTEVYAAAYKEFLETGKEPDWAAIFSSQQFAALMTNAFKIWQKRGNNIERED